MIAGMAMHHLKQRAQHEVAAAAARAEALLKAEAAALRAAHDVDVKRAEERSRAAAAAHVGRAGQNKGYFWHFGRSCSCSHASTPRWWGA